MAPPIPAGILISFAPAWVELIRIPVEMAPPILVRDPDRIHEEAPPPSPPARRKISRLGHALREVADGAGFARRPRRAEGGTRGRSGALRRGDGGFPLARARGRRGYGLRGAPRRPGCRSRAGPFLRGAVRSSLEKSGGKHAVHHDLSDRELELAAERLRELDGLGGRHLLGERDQHHRGLYRVLEHLPCALGVRGGGGRRAPRRG